MDISTEEFRRAGHEAIDWIARYFQDIRDYPVVPRVRPGEMRAQLPGSAPIQGEPLEEILADFDRIVVPAVTHWNHPRFHAYFSVSGSAPGVIGEMLIAALNVNGMVWQACPALTELELLTMSWLGEWIGLPNDWFGIIYDTASTSTLHALAAAREWIAPETREEGVTQPLTVYCSEHAHSSVDKAVLTLGMGLRQLRRVKADGEFRMIPAALRAAIEADIQEGRKPCAVVATVGTTSSTSVDPLRPIAEIAREFGTWLHVDGAYGGPAAILPEYRWILDGIELADSIVVNPHKWLFTPVDLSALYTRRPEALRNAFRLIPEYLKTDDDAPVNFMDYGFQLGRRFRALKLWMVMRAFGRERVESILRGHIAMAKDLAARIGDHPDFEVCAPVVMSLVCFRHRAGDDATHQIMTRVNESGAAFLSHTVLNGRYVLRLALGNVRTTPADIDVTWEAVQTAARELGVAPADAAAR